MAILDDVKIALRISAGNAAFDGEVQDLIDAAKADLGLSGVLDISDTDALIKRAIITYCKANFGYDNPEADRFQRSYDLLKAHLSLSIDYASYVVTFEVTDADTGLAIRGAEVTFAGETKSTSASGETIFYVRAGSNYGYTVTADGYEADDDEDNLLDVAASQTVEIALTAY